MVPARGGLNHHGYVDTAKDGGLTFQIAALKHTDGAKIDQALLMIVDQLRQRGFRLAGAVRASEVAVGQD